VIIEVPELPEPELPELVDGDVCWWLNDGTIYIVKVVSANPRSEGDAANPVRWTDYTITTERQFEPVMMSRKISREACSSFLMKRTG
jgi:hypothetical protein